MSASQNKLSISPDGESFPLPEQADYAAEYQRVKALAEAAGQSHEHQASPSSCAR